MREVEFRVPKGCDLSRADERIEDACATHGLKLGRKGSLAQHPGSVHWHFKRGSQRGTLELTLWLEKCRIWATVQDGRKTAWIDQELPTVRKAIERELNTQKARNAAGDED